MAVRLACGWRIVGAMRSLWFVALLVACGEKPQPVPPKRPNNELIVGEFARKPPAGTTAIRFGADGAVIVAKEQGELDKKPLTLKVEVTARAQAVERKMRRSL